MPNLLIARINGVWQASPANSHVLFRFVTADGDQSVAVQQFALAMRDGVQAVRNGVPEIFEQHVGYDTEQVVNTLFRTTDTLTYEARIIYGTVGDEMLIDDLEMAGEALLLVL